jgi:predicted HTH transcriptional regulator
MSRLQADSERNIKELLMWAEKSYDYTRAFKESHERRLHRLDTKRGALEKKTEEEFRSAVKKVIELENKLNRALKVFVEGKPVTRTPESPPVPVRREPSPPSDYLEARLRDLNRNQSRAIQHLRKKGRITNKDYRKIFRVSDKKAYSELMALTQMGLLKRRGKGRNTHYILAF